MTTSAYEHLQIWFRDIWAVNDALAILNRDMITVMPEGAGDSRTQQIASLSKVVHEKMSDPRLKDWINEARGHLPAGESEWHEANLALMERSYLHSATLPSYLSEKLSRMATIGEQNQTKWVKTNDWESAREHFRAFFALKQEAAKIKQDALGTETEYDALIDEFDPYSSSAKIAAVFGPVEEFLRKAIPQAVEKTKGNPQAASALKGPFKQEHQGELFRVVAESLGFDFNRGRMELIPAHPSCYGASDDQRFTTRIDEDSFIEPLRTSIHEIGHGLYEQNLPLAWRYNPVGASVGMTIHESQSLFWERQVALNPHFYHWLAPLVHNCFNLDEGEDKAVHDYLFSHKTTVTPSLIRVEADEMTYPMHVFLRFDLERRIIEGDVTADTLPEAWNEGMKERLGIEPPDNAKGCMQDVHWFAGLFGYFPSYSLGAMVAAQLEAAMRKDLHDFDEKIESGDFKPILKWLTTHIHANGSRYQPMDLVKVATGETLNSKYFIDHLTKRYLGGI
jgi:carboxypeptidase Taq